MINKIIDLNNKYRIIKCEISKIFTEDYNIYAFIPQEKYCSLNLFGLKKYKYRNLRQNLFFTDLEKCKNYFVEEKLIN